MSAPKTWYPAPERVTLGICPGCGSITVDPSDSHSCCPDTPGLMHVEYMPTVDVRVIDAWWPRDEVSEPAPVSDSTPQGPARGRWDEMTAVEQYDYVRRLESAVLSDTVTR